MPPEAAAKLQAYLDLLARWNQVYNLTALRDPALMRSHHVDDSLSIVAPLERHAEGRPLSIVDVTCVDAVEKKARFVQQVALELGLPNLRSVHSRVERMPPAGADVVVSRAFASLPDFCAWTRRHLGPQGVWLAMKGKHPADEIAALPADVQVFHVEQLAVPGLDAERCAIWLRPAATPAAQ